MSLDLPVLTREPKDVLDPNITDAAPPLRLVFWESTAGCNLECVHCRRLDVSRDLMKTDLSTEQAAAFIRTLPETGRPILVLSGGEPLFRPDIFELAEVARSVDIPTALATNGTIMNDEIARKIISTGIKRVSVSFDGPDAPTHDIFRGAGAFDLSVVGVKLMRKYGISVQINTTIAQHNVRKVDDTYKLALDLGADALHIFMLVPVGCGMELSPDIMLNDEEYERTLNWIYDRSLEGKLHLKATCAPHYFRVMRQRAKQDGKPMPASAHPHKNMGPMGHPSGVAHAHSGHPGDHGMKADMTAMTKGCLAGQSVCFVSHEGDVFPCGYLPVSSGNIKSTPLPTIWKQSKVFHNLRHDETLEGKCGVCEYKKVCMGCRARAFSESGNYLAEEPNCGFTPHRMKH
jgi:radical SAM protein with 4Fe4S-binding SPASM domain